MKMAIYKRGKYSRSLFVAFGKDEITHLFGRNEPSGILVDMIDDGKTVLLRAATADQPGTKITRSRNTLCLSKAVTTLGLDHLREFASATEVETEWLTDDGGVTSIKVPLPNHFVAHETKPRRRRTTVPSPIPMNDGRLRAMLDLLNETTEKLGLRLAVENNKVVAFRTVEVPL